MAFQLTDGAIRALHENEMGSNSVVVQVLNIKKINPQNGQANAERYRLIISDGRHYIQAMVATNLNPVLTGGELMKNGVIRVDKGVTNQVQGRKIVIILEMQVMTPHDESQPKIGNPANIEPNAGEGGAQAQAQPAAVQQQPQQQFQQPPQQQYQPQQPQQQSFGSQGNQGRPQQAQQQQGYGGQQQQSMGGGQGHTMPIANLNPYQQKWMICARASNKSDIKTWSNQRGEGKLFSVTFLDESGEIRATAFNDQCTKFYDQIQEGGVYFLSKAEIKVAKQNSFSMGAYELSFRNDTVLEKCNDTGVGIPTIKYNFVTVSQIGEYDKDATVDVIAVVKDCGELQQIISKTTQKPLEKRDLTIVDDSHQSIRMTLWGKQAMQFKSEGHPVIAVKNAKVGDFGGRSLSLYSTSTLAVDPDIPETFRLRSWYDTEGNDTQFGSFAGQTLPGGRGGDGGGRKDVTKTVAAIRDEQLGQGDGKPDYFNLKATVVFIRNENVAYPACPTDGCNKKVVEEGAGQWRCEKCQKTFLAPNYRYILSLSVSDHTGQTWLSAFNETAGPILGGIDANQLIKMKDDDSVAYNKVFEESNYKTYVFKVRAKMENYQDEMKVKCSVVSATPVDWENMSQNLIEQIAAYGM